MLTDGNDIILLKNSDDHMGYIKDIKRNGATAAIFPLINFPRSILCYKVNSMSFVKCIIHGNDQFILLSIHGKSIIDKGRYHFAFLTF